MSASNIESSSSAVLAEVDQLANVIQKSASEPLTPAQARAEVWRAHPELQVEVRKAKAGEKDAGQETAKWIDSVVHSYVVANSANPEYFGKGQGLTLSQIKRELLATPAGIEIKALRSAVRTGEVSASTATNVRHVWRRVAHPEALGSRVPVNESVSVKLRTLSVRTEHLDQRVKDLTGAVTSLNGRVAELSIMLGMLDQERKDNFRQDLAR